MNASEYNLESKIPVQHSDINQSHPVTKDVPVNWSPSKILKKISLSSDAKVLATLTDGTPLIAERAYNSNKNSWSANTYNNNKDETTKNGSDNSQSRFSNEPKPELSNPGFYYGNNNKLQSQFLPMGMMNYMPSYNLNQSNPNSTMMTPSTNVSNSTPKQTSQPGSIEKQPTEQSTPSSNDTILKTFFSNNYSSPNPNKVQPPTYMGNPTIGPQLPMPNAFNPMAYNWYFLQQLNGQNANLPSYEKPSQPSQPSTK